ncbi:hypothetical protein AWM75_01590 [Aerococcus urinaehominis]|uniref:Uncharacterized protein n=1 Tax=Aerococcus urinaehominis TaxID=128944 RepID=A0A0X8FK34_9LACT|nr:PTS glucose transporter subunit IIA [Aerococcus urinaehominis]AMB98765.1 hypothetical protein AWM75_01590 [Aerococcus urinaehominis]SDM13534.1 PTS system, glucose subfamily, IIA component [Aerococcus urinaehominis]
MFNFLKTRKNKLANQLNIKNHVQLDQLYAVGQGKIMAIEEVNDQIFSQKLLGDGYGLYPDCNQVYAPLAGEIGQIFPSRHALSIVSASGLEILVHMGVETASLDGEAYQLLVEEGQQVEVGDQLVEMDCNQLVQLDFDPTICVIIHSTFSETCLDPNLGQMVEAGDHVASIVSYPDI